VHKPLRQDVLGYQTSTGTWQILEPNKLFLSEMNTKKAAIKDEIGDVALVLTILESKGMEFDDVFLLDFFASTPCGPGLRLLENIFEQHGQNQLANNALLCSELKHLYVAVTRPRNRLWMFESSPDAVKSIVKLFTDGKNMPRPLIEVVAKDHPKIQEKLEMLKPATSSDPKKYSEMGYNLLNRQLFKDAHFCFRKAKDKVGQKIAQAHLHMEEGRGERSRGNYKNFLDLFQKAVDLFFETSRSGNAAYCLEDMGKLEEAADVYAQMGKYEKAAVLYLDARSFLKASGCFDVVERYADAAAALRQGQMFDHLVNYLASNHDRLDPKVAAGYSKLCTILHKQGRISSGLEGLIVDTLGSDEEKIGFYEKCRLTQKLAKFRFIKHEYGLGFQVLVQDGKLREALDAALRYMNQCVDIPDSDVITVTNFMRFNDIHAVVDGHSPNSWSATDIQSASVADAFEKWDIFQTSVQNFRGRWAMVFPTLENDLHREVFSLLV
jgi:tetratricopeptide (TPR) repeat protein